MKKKSLHIVFAFVLVLGFSLGAALPVAAATTWTVDDDDATKDFSSISDAITAASDGDTIEVYDGTYSENVVVNKELTIQAAAENSPVVDGVGSGACFGIYKDTGLSDVTIDGFEIQNARYGIWIYGASPSPSTTYSHITLTSNNIHDHTGSGIYVTDATVNDITISNNNIDSCEAGIGVANKSIVDTMVADSNILTNNDMGIALIDDTISNVIVSNCYFEGNAWEHLDLGTFNAWPSLSNISVTGCQFLSGPWCGVYVQSNFTDYDIVLRYNQFSVGYCGIGNVSTNIVDAACNWWGDVSGPYDDKDLDGLGLLNTGGLGDPVGATLWLGDVDYVDYEPWLLSSEGPCYGYVGIAECFENPKNHGQFVSCIAKFTKSLVKDGTITAEERAEIVSWAAQSDIGK